MEQLQDSEIIDRILNGEKAFYELIVRRYNAFLYKIGRFYNYNHEDTEDLMQDTYVDAFNSLSHFERRSSFKSWLMRIMLNNCYRKKKKFSYKNESSQENINENLHPMFNTTDSDVRSQINTRELGRIIEKSLERIAEDYRMVFCLREMTGLHVAETAKLLDISESNVKVRLNRAKAMLRKELEKSYSQTEIFEFNLIYCDAMVDRVMKSIGV